MNTPPTPAGESGRAGLPADEDEMLDLIGDVEDWEASGNSDSKPRCDYSFMQIEPEIDALDWEVRLVIRPGSEAAVDELMSGYGDWLSSLLKRVGDIVRLSQRMDRSYVATGVVYRAIRALAPHLADIRFLMVDTDSRWVGEAEIRDGQLRTRYRMSDFDCGEGEDSIVEYLLWQLESRPEDVPLRRFTVQLLLFEAEPVVTALSRGYPVRDHHLLRWARSCLAQAAWLDPGNPTMRTQRHLIERLAPDPGTGRSQPRPES
jgi:hypothetical protein